MEEMNDVVHTSLHSRRTTATPETGIDRQIEEQNRCTEQKLGVTRQGERVEDRFKVAFNECNAVAAPSPQPAEIIFQICKRA